MDSRRELRRLSQYLPGLPEDVADRIARALVAESARRAGAQSRRSGRLVAVPAQGSRSGGEVASPLPRPRTEADSG